MQRLEGDINRCLKHDMLQQRRTPDPHLERLGGVRFRGDERRRDLLGDRRLRLLALSGLLALFFPLQNATAHQPYRTTD